jgi:hypothetical protein
MVNSLTLRFNFLSINVDVFLRRAQLPQARAVPVSKVKFQQPEQNSAVSIPRVYQVRRRLPQQNSGTRSPAPHVEYIQLPCLKMPCRPCSITGFSTVDTAFPSGRSFRAAALCRPPESTGRDGMLHAQLIPFFYW